MGRKKISEVELKANILASKERYRQKKKEDIKKYNRDKYRITHPNCKPRTEGEKIILETKKCSFKYTNGTDTIECTRKVKGYDMCWQHRNKIKENKILDDINKDE